MLGFLFLSSTVMITLRDFTLQELSNYDGKDGRPIYIAYRGKVYDVSRSYHWRRGIHQVTHVAGIDLTTQLSQAPHGDDLIQKFPLVGRLVGKYPFE